MKLAIVPSSGPGYLAEVAYLSGEYVLHRILNGYCEWQNEYEPDTLIVK